MLVADTWVVACSTDVMPQYPVALTAATNTNPLIVRPAKRFLIVHCIARLPRPQTSVSTRCWLALLGACVGRLALGLNPRRVFFVSAAGVDLELLDQATELGRSLHQLLRRLLCIRRSTCRALRRVRHASNIVRDLGAALRRF